MKADGKSIRTFFDRMAVDRDKNIDTDPVLHFEQRCRSKTALALLNPSESDRILEIGCGNARDISVIAARAAHVTGIDLSDEMIAEARSKFATRPDADRATFEQGDATCLKYGAGSFDKVLASEVLEHIPAWSTALREIFRVLKPGGIAVVTTPNRHSWYGFDRYIVFQGVQRKAWPHPYDEWKTLSELKAELRAAGFQIEQGKSMCFVPGFLVPYRIPRPLKSVLVFCVSLLEPFCSMLLPACGYMVAVKVRKPVSISD